MNKEKLHKIEHLSRPFRKWSDCESWAAMVHALDNTLTWEGKYGFDPTVCHQAVFVSRANYWAAVRSIEFMILYINMADNTVSNFRLKRLRNTEILILEDLVEALKSHAHAYDSSIGNHPSNYIYMMQHESVLIIYFQLLLANIASSIQYSAMHENNSWSIK